MKRCDVKICQQTNHFTNETWFELFEIESGEVLQEGTHEECLNYFQTLDQNKYELLPH